MKLVFINVLILFILMFIGYILGKRGTIAHSSINDLTNLLIDVSIPATIIVSMIRPYSPELMKDTVRVLVIILIYHLGIAAASYLLTKILKVDDKKRGAWIFAMVFSNNGFIGYPLMYAIYGQEGLFIMAMGNIVQNVLIFSLGVKMITMNYELDEKIRLKNILLTRQNLAIVIGMTLFISQIPVPGVIVSLLTYLGNLTAPLSMIVVGLSLSRYNVKNMFTDSEAYRMTIFRMIIIPMIILIGFKLGGVSANKDLPFAILFYTAALPSPALTSIMAERYNTSAEFSSRCVFITTIASVVTVPLFAGLL